MMRRVPQIGERKTEPKKARLIDAVGDRVGQQELK
jgi:hypothetical protein